jgi:hypothetical protein
MLAVQLALLIVAALIAYRLIGESAHMTGLSLLAGVRLFLTGNRILLITESALLLGWPVLAIRWGRLWAAGPATVNGPPPGHGAPNSLPWGSYAAAAMLPAVLLGASFAPLPAAFPQAPATAPVSAACAGLANWDSAGGIKAKDRVDADISKIVTEIDSPTAAGMIEQAAVTESDAATALRTLPPGPARADYHTAMTDFTAFAVALLALDAKTAGTDLGNGIAADQEASALLAREMGGCARGAGSALASAGPPPAATPGVTTRAGRPAAGRLLSAADLPAGYAPYVLPPTLPTASDELACMAILNDLTITATSTINSVPQVGVAFAAGPAGPELVEVLRVYAGERAAAAAFTTLTATLASCHRFTVRWTSPPASAVESVRPLGQLHLGSQSWSASVLTASSPPVQVTLIGIRVDDTDAYVQVLPLNGEPTPAQIRAIAARAAAKLAA